MKKTSESFFVDIQPGGLQFSADGSTPLLISAERAGIRMPSSCRNGTCRTCLCRVLSGQIRYGIEWPGVSADEKKEGYMLPCVAYPLSPLVIDVPLAAAAGQPRNHSPS
ncbi:2Fe-2S iron-sulfur cluster-binding protein [Noviherbaspirillum sp.]|uniref:2Fe-2S iron-sulfur cluster-binding protein n=1 Tax=Noviherbaspirillum sp. TaxID=1926288 RepID=UPI002FE0D70F